MLEKSTSTKNFNFMNKKYYSDFKNNGKKLFTNSYLFKNMLDRHKIKIEKYKKLLRLKSKSDLIQKNKHHMEIINLKKEANNFDVLKVIEKKIK